MGKHKAKRRNLSDRFKQSTSSKKSKLNPFEMHVNRQKYDVVGRKLKSDKGLPGISRSKAIKKRKETILQEYKIKDKANRFLDRRIGERNSAMTSEDRVIARFTAERMKMFNKKQLFNLADDEVLTHRGQALTDIEKFDDPRSEDEEEVEEERAGRLGADFVEDAHFGGGLLKKTGEGEKKSHKDLIEQLIAESKKRKAEKQKTREQTMELTEKLDTEWQDLLPIVSATKKKPDDHIEVEKPDAYDTIMRELKFEARGRPSDPLKSEAEAEEEEKKKRAEFEAERERRMFGVGGPSSSEQARHRSADDLDDGFDIEEEAAEVAVSYDLEGNIKVQGNAEGIGEDGVTKENSEAVNNDDDDDDDDDAQDSEDDEEEEEKDDDDDSLSDLKPPSESEMEAENSEEDKGTSNEDNAETIIDNSTAKQKQPLRKGMSENDKKVFLQEVRKKKQNISSVPEDYTSFQKLLNPYNAEQQAVILSHLMEKNDLSLSENNRTTLETLFSYTLQHLCESASKPLTDPSHCFAVLDNMAPLIYDLTQKLMQSAADSTLEVIKEKQQKFQEHQHKYPSLSTLILFKLVSMLYPTSDFRHPIVTPSIVFISQMLFQCRIKTKRDVSCGLFLATLILEYTVLSKRFSPAAINFLSGVVYLAVPKNQKNLPTVPPFKKSGPLSELLVLEESRKEMQGPFQMKRLDLVPGEPVDDNFKVRALYTAVAMLHEFLLNLNAHQCSSEIFHTASHLLAKFPTHRYPERISSEVQKFLKAHSKLKEQSRQYLVAAKKRPKALRLYEPSIEKIFDVKRRRPMGKAKAEQEKLLHKIKREQKSAVREIRRDNDFITKVKWKETVRSDQERVAKVKEIFGSAAMQQGELRQIQRKKKK